MRLGEERFRGTAISGTPLKRLPLLTLCQPHGSQQSTTGTLVIGIALSPPPTPSPSPSTTASRTQSKSPSKSPSPSLGSTRTAPLASSLSSFASSCMSSSAFTSAGRCGVLFYSRNQSRNHSRNLNTNLLLKSLCILLYINGLNFAITLAITPANSHFFGLTPVSVVRDDVIGALCFMPSWTLSWTNRMFHSPQFHAQATGNQLFQHKHCLGHLLLAA